MTQVVETSELTDGALLTRLSAGDKAAWDALVRRHADIVFSVVSRIVRTPADAEDAGQETFLRLKDYAHTFDKVRYGENARNWIATIACREALKINVRRAGSKNVPYDDDMGGGVADKHSTGPSKVEEHEIHALLRDAVQNLPQRQREAIVMHFAAGMTQMEIAAELKCDQSTISDRIRQGLDKLRQKLGPAGLAMSVGPALISSSLLQQAPATFVQGLVNHAVWTPAAIAAAKTAKAGATGFSAVKAALWATTAVVALTAGYVTVKSMKGSAPSAAPATIGGFEDNTLQGWEANENTTVSVVEEHAGDGTRSLKMVMSPGNFPGIKKVFSQPPDWRQYRALQANVFNGEAQEVKLSVRVDDAESQGFGSRFNCDDVIRLRPGANEIEIPVANLWNGSLLSRGLNVDKISSLRFHLNRPDKPVTLWIDNIHMVSKKEDSPTSMPIALSHVDPVGTAQIEHAADGSLVVAMPEGKGYVGAEIFTPQDWLSYDELAVDLNVEGGPLKAGLSIKLFDHSGRQETVNSHALAGECHIRLPVELFGEVALSHLKTLSVFTSAEDQPRTVMVKQISLQRHRLADGVPRHKAAAAGDPVSIDFSPIRGMLGANSFQAIAWVPEQGGGYRVVRCNSEGKGVASYSIAADDLKDLDPQQPVRVWAFCREHGVWLWNYQEQKKDPAAPLVLTYRTMLGN